MKIFVIIILFFLPIFIKIPNLFKMKYKIKNKLWDFIHRYFFMFFVGFFTLSGCHSKAKLKISYQKVPNDVRRVLKEKGFNYVWEQSNMSASRCNRLVHSTDSFYVLNHIH